MVQLGAVLSSQEIFPSSSSDNAIVRWDGNSGKTLQNSGATIDDSGNLIVNNLTACFNVYACGCMDAYCGFYCDGYGGGSDYFQTGDGRYAYFCGGAFYYVS